MPPSPADFLLAERLLSAPYDTDVDLYRALHRAAGTLVSADAFYVCVVQRAPDWLHFVYNCEGDHFDKPEPFPMGDGPTSRVAREGAPVVISEARDRDAYTLKSFADHGTRSGSAVHWPLRVEEDGLPDAVFSVQAYATGAYGTDALATIEWLGLRFEDAMRRRRVADRVRQEVESAEAEASRRRAVDDVRRFVSLLEDLVPLRDEPARLIAEIRRRQVELTGWAPTAPVVKDGLAEALATLSPRELEVLVHVAQGLSNKEVARVLALSEHTVKRHLDNVYHATPLRHRGEAVAALDAIRHLYMARSGD